MSIAAEVKSAQSPSAAIHILAKHLDLISDRLNNLETADSGWDSWDEPEVITPSVDHDEVQQKIKELEDQMSKPGVEAEDIRALEAKRRLLIDELSTPPDFVDAEGERPTVEVDGETVTINLPEAAEERKEQRRQFAKEILKLDEALGAESFIESYAIGGPLWLYYGNRELLMQYPDDTKRVMVSDVLDFSPAEAQEMARDILKDAEAGTPEQTLERILGGK